VKHEEGRGGYVGRGQPRSRTSVSSLASDHTKTTSADRAAVSELARAVRSGARAIRVDRRKFPISSISVAIPDKRIQARVAFGPKTAANLAGAVRTLEATRRRAGRAQAKGTAAVRRMAGRWKPTAPLPPQTDQTPLDGGVSFVRPLRTNKRRRDLDRRDGCVGSSE